MTVENRRELATRKIGFFQNLAKFLIRLGLTPNQVSVLSIFFGLLGGCGFYLMGCGSYITGLITAFVGIQMRLLCNMTDGLMAVEGGMKSVVGDIYNDFPDRLSDIFIIFGSCLVIQEPWGHDLGWITSVLAVMTAYVRLLGMSMGYKADFCGPMAKQHRMGLLNVTLLIALVGYFVGFESQVSRLFTVALVVMSVGAAATCWRRLCRLTRFLRAKTE